MAWCNSDSSDIEEIDIPTLVLPYQYQCGTACGNSTHHHFDCTVKCQKQIE